MGVCRGYHTLGHGGRHFLHTPITMAVSMDNSLGVSLSYTPSNVRGIPVRIPRGAFSPMLTGVVAQGNEAALSHLLVSGWVRKCPSCVVARGRRTQQWGVQVC